MMSRAGRQELRAATAVDRVPEDVRARIVTMALDYADLSPRELVKFADTESYFVSEISVYPLFKAHDVITSPPIVIGANDEFKGQNGSDRLHVPEGHRPGIVPPVDHPLRFLSLHHPVEAMHQHEGGRCH